MTCKLIPVVLDFLHVALLRLNPALDGALARDSSLASTLGC